jgi:hypothetical protein
MAMDTNEWAAAKQVASGSYFIPNTSDITRFSITFRNRPPLWQLRISFGWVGPLMNTYER